MALARRAGKIMVSTPPEITEYKGSKENFATDTDLAIQEFLQKELLDILPGSEFLGEENAHISKEKHLLWIVDPIDGTVNYSRGLSMSVISIALVKDGVSVLGVVYNPYLDEMYHSVRGEGSYMNGKRLSVSDKPKEQSMVCTSWSAYDKTLAHDCFAISEKVQSECIDIRRFGTAAYELCLLARGSIDIYFEIALCPWDYAAGCLILEEAGGECGKLDRSIDFDHMCSFIGANSKENFEYMRTSVLDVIGDFRLNKSIWE